MKQELAQDIALMRYSMISPLIVGLPDEYRSKEAYFRAASAPVSYTHLKDIDESVLAVKSDCLWEKGSLLDIKNLVTPQLFYLHILVNPVSYTHLDVYKRQALSVRSCA